MNRDVLCGAVHGVRGKRWRALQERRNGQQLGCTRPCTEYVVRGGAHSRKGEMASNWAALGTGRYVHGGAMHRTRGGRQVPGGEGVGTPWGSA